MPWWTLDSAPCGRLCRSFPSSLVHSNIFFCHRTNKKTALNSPTHPHGHTHRRRGTVFLYLCERRGREERHSPRRRDTPLPWFYGRSLFIYSRPFSEPSFPFCTVPLAKSGHPLYKFPPPHPLSPHTQIKRYSEQPGRGDSRRGGRRRRRRRRRRRLVRGKPNTLRTSASALVASRTESFPGEERG